MFWVNSLQIIYITDLNIKRWSLITCEITDFIFVSSAFFHLDTEKSIILASFQDVI